MAAVIDVPHTSYLPLEIVANLFKFLPAKSLVNFRLVCSDWKELAEKELTSRRTFVSRIFQSDQFCRRGPRCELEVNVSQH